MSLARFTPRDGKGGAMTSSTCLRRALLLMSLQSLFVSSGALAQAQKDKAQDAATPAVALRKPATVQMDVKGDDQTMEYLVTKAGAEAIKASQGHVLVTTGVSDIVIRIAVATVRKSPEAKDPIGVAIAYVVTRRAAGGAKDITNLMNSFAPVGSIDTSVRAEIKRILGA